MFNIDFSKITTPDLKKYTKYIFILFVIGFILLGYFIWLPKYREFENNRKELNSENDRIKEKRKYLLDMENSLNGLSSYQDEILKINSSIPVGQDADVLFSFIQRVASESGMLLTEVGFSEENLNKSSRNRATQDEQGAVNIKQLEISFSVKGKYLAFKKFISILYRSSRLVNVGRISIEPPPISDEVSDIYTFNMSLEANYYDNSSEQGLESGYYDQSGYYE